MTNPVRTIVSLFFCATALAACATRPPPSEASPTVSELAQWKKDVLGRYKQVAYLNAGNLPISESDFMEAVRGGRSGFTMNVTSQSPDRMTVRLLRPDEVTQVATEVGR